MEVIIDYQVINKSELTKTHFINNYQRGRARASPLRRQTFGKYSALRGRSCTPHLDCKGIFFNLLVDNGPDIHRTLNYTIPATMDL